MTCRSRSFLCIQKPDTEIQISSEGQPDQIGNLQLCSQRIHLPEGQNHPQYQSPQQQQPDKSKPVGLGVEENGTPEEIHHQLGNEEIQSPASLLGRRGKIDSCCPNAHQCIQYRPDDGKCPAGRRQWRLNNGLRINIGAFSGKPSGEGTYGL